MKGSTALLSMLALWTCLLGDPKAILAASPDELQKTHDSTQQEIRPTRIGSRRCRTNWTRCLAKALTQARMALPSTTTISPPSRKRSWI